MHMYDGCGIGMRLRDRLRTAPHDGYGAHRKLSGIRPHVALDKSRILQIFYLKNL